MPQTFSQETYIVLIEVTESVYDPPYDSYSTGGYSCVTVNRYLLADSVAELTKIIQTNGGGKILAVYAGKKVTPKLTVEVKPEV